MPLQDTPKDAGFRVTPGVAIAHRLRGGIWRGPVIGILAEFDALPGITQTASPERMLRQDRQAGHACGHHLRHGLRGGGHCAQESHGRARPPGTPSGLWHASGGRGLRQRYTWFVRGSSRMRMWSSGTPETAMRPTPPPAWPNRLGCGYGQSAHAAAAPERGRSALDGVEARPSW